MPYVERSNNRIIPSNSRAADVAERAVSEIMPVQQARYMNAFRVQGIQCIHYSHLRQGRKCTCGAARKTLNTILGQDGKASQGAINALITGQDEMSFNVTPYNFNQQRVTGVKDETSPFAAGNKNQGVFDIKTSGEEFPFADVAEGPDFGDNGPSGGIDLDALVQDFDIDSLGFGDVSCPVCFGTSFIGGYTADHTHRHVLTVADVQMTRGEMQIEVQPWAAESPGFTTTIILPRGAVSVDSFRVLNGIKAVNASFKLDGRSVKSITDILARCDGKTHILEAVFPDTTIWTHFESQYALSKESAYFEFPRRSKSSDTGLLDTSEPFQIILSPNVPTLAETDIIVESQQGKTLIVQGVNPWTSRNRDTLGWECQVRVIQPQEIYRVLPSRGRILTKDRTTLSSSDNVSGPRRT